MLAKPSYKQRTISQLEIHNEKKVEIGIKVIEARLEESLSAKNPYFKVVSGEEIWKSQPAANGGMHPKWNEYRLIRLLSESLDVIVAEKGFLFGETEIGRCTILLTDVVQGHSTDWWSILSPKKEMAGAVLMSFEFYEPDTNFTHSSNSSWDLRGIYYPDSSPVVQRAGKAQSINISSLTPGLPKALNFNTEPDEVNQLEKLKYDLLEENERLMAQESKVRLVYDKLKNESNRLKMEKVEIKKCTESLKAKEETILSQRAQLENEKLFIAQGKEDIAKLRESLNLSYSRLKLEKLKIRTYKKLLEKNKVKLDERSAHLDHQKNRIKKQSQLRQNPFD